jgi:hypothetical protein
MIAFLGLVLHVVASPFKTQARLEAEIVMLRHQLNVLRRHVRSKPKLAVADRLLFVFAVSPVSIGVERGHDYPTGCRHPVASNGFPTVLALEVALSGWSAEDTPGDPAPDPGDEPGQSAVGRAPHPW